MRLNFMRLSSHRMPDLSPIVMARLMALCTACHARC